MRCLTCKTRIRSLRLTPSGVKYFCDQCGKRLSPEEVLRPPSRNEDAVWASTKTVRENPPEDKSLPAGLLRVSIVLGLKSASLEQAVGEMVPRALHGAGPIVFKSREIAGKIREKLKSSGAEDQHGVAFVHARVEGLPAAKAALGIAPSGLPAPPPAQGRIYVVFLSLTPQDHAGPEIPAWARRELGNEKTVYQLSSASDVEAVIRILNAEP